MMRIQMSKIIEIRNMAESFRGLEVEKYACELAGVEFSEKHFRARVARPIEFDLIEPLPQQPQSNAAYLLTLLTKLPEEKMYQCFDGSLKCDSGKSFEEEYGVEFI